MQHFIILSAGEFKDSVLALFYVYHTKVKVDLYMYF